MQRSSFDSQFNRLQVVLFFILMGFALACVAPQAMANGGAHSEGNAAEQVVIDVDVVGGVLAFRPHEVELDADLAKRAGPAKPVPPTFFQWVDRGGVLSFTNNPRWIPNARKDGAVERRFLDIEARVTVVDPAEKPRAKKMLPARPIDSACDQPVRWTRSWERQDGYRRVVYRVTDPCGQPSYEGLSAPSIER